MNKDKLQSFLLVVLLFFLSLFPFQYKLLKILIIFIIITVNLLKVKYENFYFKWFIIFILYNIFFLFEGEIYNPGIVKYYIGTAFLNILLYMLIFNFKSDIIIFKKIEKILFIVFYITFFIFFIYYIHYNYSFINIGFNTTVFFLNKIIYVKEILKPGQYSKISVYTHNIVVLTFLIPYILVSAYFRLREKRGFLKYLIYNFLFVLIIYFTLRKVLILILLLSHLLLLFFSKLYGIKIKIKKRKIITIVLLLFFMLLVIYKKNADILSYIIRSFNYAKSNHNYGGVQERVLQAVSLLKEFYEKPFLGHGIGANAAVVRSFTVPGAYELTYLAMLFQRGIIGVLIYLIMISSIFLEYYNISRNKKISNEFKKYILSYSMGLIGILIADATNPALQSFEYAWILYINIFVISTLKYNLRSKE